MSEDRSYIPLFDRAIRELFRDALRVAGRRPSMAAFLFQTILRQGKAARLRGTWEERGTHVPPFMILSVTKRCNLRCKGCYAMAHRAGSGEELDLERLRGILAEAAELGISIVLIAGGEPLTRPEILDLTAAFPGTIFPLFTNGLLLDEKLIARIKRQKQVVPVLSLEGRRLETDERRGAGVFAELAGKMRQLAAAGVFFGASFTLTRDNFHTALDESLIRSLMDAGCRLFFFVDFVPVEEGTAELTLTEEQRGAAGRRLEEWRTRLPGLFIALPGDEEKYGGCLAAGRGFLHVSADGRLEACPFAPFSDTDLKAVSLRAALASPLLAAIRANADQLTETSGGCALWAKREWVGSLARAQNMERGI